MILINRARRSSAYIKEAVSEVLTKNVFEICCRSFQHVKVYAWKVCCNRPPKKVCYSIICSSSKYWWLENIFSMKKRIYAITWKCLNHFSSWHWLRIRLSSWKKYFLHVKKIRLQEKTVFLDLWHGIKINLIVLLKLQINRE